MRGAAVKSWGGAYGHDPACTSRSSQNEVPGGTGASGTREWHDGGGRCGAGATVKLPLCRVEAAHGIHRAGDWQWGARGEGGVNRADSCAEGETHRGDSDDVGEALDRPRDAGVVVGDAAAARRAVGGGAARVRALAGRRHERAADGGWARRNRAALGGRLSEADGAASEGRLERAGGGASLRGAPVRKPRLESGRQRRVHRVAGRVRVGRHDAAGTREVRGPLGGARQGQRRRDAADGHARGGMDRQVPSLRNRHRGLQYCRCKRRGTSRDCGGGTFGGGGGHTMPEGRKVGARSWRSSVKAPGRRVKATARRRSLRRYCSCERGTWWGSPRNGASRARATSCIMTKQQVRAKARAPASAGWWTWAAAAHGVSAANMSSSSDVPCTHGNGGGVSTAVLHGNAAVAAVPCAPVPCLRGSRAAHPVMRATGAAAADSTPGRHAHGGRPVRKEAA